VYIEYFHVSAQHYGFLFALNIVGIMFGNYLNTRLVGRLGPVPIISFAATVSFVASLFVCIVSLTGWGGLWSIVFGLFFVVSVVGVLSANCTTDLMHRYPMNAGAAAAVFGAVQLALGALSSLAVGLWQDGSPKGMGVTVGVAGLLCYLGRILVVRWHGAKAPVAAV
jgi:DHA1 family bicyclomycin/chloramphenicol resistance-like MFS transporter